MIKEYTYKNNVLTCGCCCQDSCLEMGLILCQGLVLAPVSYLGSGGFSDAAVSSLAEHSEHLQFPAVHSESQHAVLKTAAQNQTCSLECLLLTLNCSSLLQHRSQCLTPAMSSLCSDSTIAHTASYKPNVPGDCHKPQNCVYCLDSGYSSALHSLNEKKCTVILVLGLALCTNLNSRKIMHHTLSISL